LDREGLREVNSVLHLVPYIVLGIPAIGLALNLVVRIVRAFHKFPMPQWAANLIDNPLRRRIQPPDEMARRHGIEAGMTVLEVGPGNGTYTLAAARRVGNDGSVVAVDIEPRMIERVQRRLEAEGVTNVEARVADVYDLPFDDATFDAIYMIAVIGEIPQPARALQEFRRVLAPSGTLAFSELLPDPDYPRASTLVKVGTAAGFRLQRKVGKAFHYTLVFDRGP
jgi:ubiquinone/menaquinone biosynthesis C-methylase UbiE